jgi:8-oxo-dGTP diphosphatase
MTTLDVRTRYVPTVLCEGLVADGRAEGIQKFVVGAVIHQDDAALVVTRSMSDDFLPGIDELPSGGVEPGETLVAALDRETMEEVGFAGQPIDDGFIASFDYTSGSGHRTRQLTVSVPLNGRRVRLSDEHTSSRWIRRSELASTSVTEETRGVLRSWFTWASARRADAGTGVS